MKTKEEVSLYLYAMMYSGKVAARIIKSGMSVTKIVSLAASLKGKEREAVLQALEKRITSDSLTIRQLKILFEDTRNYRVRQELARHIKLRLTRDKLSIKVVI